MTFKTESQVRSQASACKFYDGSSGTGTCWPPGTSDRLSPANCQNSYEADQKFWCCCDVDERLEVEILTNCEFLGYNV